MTGLGLSLSGKFRSSAKLCQPAARVCFDHVLQSAMGTNVLAGFVPTRGGLAYIICTYISLIHQIYEKYLTSSGLHVKTWNIKSESTRIMTRRIFEEVIEASRCDDSLRNIVPFIVQTNFIHRQGNLKILQDQPCSSNHLVFTFESRQISSFFNISYL